MRKLAILIGLLAACGANGKTAGNADCKQVAAKGLELLKAKTLADVEKETGEKLDETMQRIAWAMMAEKAGLPVEPERQLEALTQKCVERGDSQKKRNCLARAKSVDDMNGCSEAN